MRPRRGVALVLVLWIVVLLGTVGAGVVGAARTASRLAENARARVTARYAAESGIEALRAEVAAALSATATGPDGEAGALFLNSLESRPADSVSFGDGLFVVAVFDPGARLDVNAAPVTSLARLFATVTDVGRGEQTAAAIRRWIQRGPDGRAGIADSPVIEPVRSLEELRTIPGADEETLERAAPYLTVDGDGTVNVSRAARPVLDAAVGEHRTSPSRLVFISRGWRRGHPLTHEIQATFAFSNASPVLVQWRERTP